MYIIVLYIDMTIIKALSACVHIYYVYASATIYIYISYRRYIIIIDIVVVLGRFCFITIILKYMIVIRSFIILLLYSPHPVPADNDPPECMLGAGERRATVAF